MHLLCRIRNEADSRCASIETSFREKVLYRRETEVGYRDIRVNYP